MIFSLNEKSKNSIEKITGMSYNDIVSMDVEDLSKKIGKRAGKNLHFNSDNDSRLPGMRGSIYWGLGRWFNFNHKKMNRYIDKL
jgi:hypothetical protein